MQKKLPQTKVIDKSAVVRIAIAKAGGQRALSEALGLSRTIIHRHLNGINEMRAASFQKILDYVNA